MVAVVGGPIMPPIELRCPVVGCDLGEDGGRYKTPELEIVVELGNLGSQKQIGSAESF